ncbi:MAG: hypothetical protein QMD53_02210 [Actinomycetota bacterium]|nr:hypothetical protein [Actinomycetota bacterium]
MLVFISIGLLLSFSRVYAADALVRMLQADEHESFQQDQDAFIVGKLIGKNDLGFEVEVLRVLSGSVIADVIIVSSDFTYGWDDPYERNMREPHIGDFCVFSLKRAGGLYKKAWGIFKADSGDHNTLNLVPANAPAWSMLGSLACIEWYTNSGGEENDFYFVENEVYTKRPDGQDVRIYPPPYYQDKSLTHPHEAESDLSERVRYISVGALVLFGAGSTAFLSKKRKDNAQRRSNG